MPTETQEKLWPKYVAGELKGQAYRTTERSPSHTAEATGTLVSHEYIPLTRMQKHTSLKKRRNAPKIRNLRLSNQDHGVLPCRGVEVIEAAPATHYEITRNTQYITNQGKARGSRAIVTSRKQDVDGRPCPVFVVVQKKFSALQELNHLPKPSGANIVMFYELYREKSTFSFVYEPVRLSLAQILGVEGNPFAINCGHDQHSLIGSICLQACFFFFSKFSLVQLPLHGC